ncbi:BBT_collapsed_G0014010.mRNA.1.CDS.1 [Saccharomyces cerevisiae]|nr:BBT_collapsed_G0014010.mRNA.1.CDS.1 [Saccharomyces cerevisiae]
MLPLSGVQLGQKRIFNYIYPIFKWCWLIGACIGIFFGVWKRWGKFYPRYFDPMLFVGGMLNMGPPYNLMYYTSGMIVSYISQYYMKRHHLNLWEKYNYVLSAGFSTGLVLSAIIIFFAVQYKDTAFNWWGNTVPYAGADGVGYPLKNITDTANGYFGYAPGHYP